MIAHAHFFKWEKLSGKIRRESNVEEKKKKGMWKKKKNKRKYERDRDRNIQKMHLNNNKKQLFIGLVSFTVGWNVLM